MAPSQLQHVDRILDPLEECFTPDVARRIVALRAKPDVEQRIATLAEKSSAGTLTSDERLEYEGYVRGIDIVTLLQSKARRYLA
jgi:hypothetical protein